MHTAPDQVRTAAPYHLLGRGAGYRWWRPLTEVLLFAVLLGVFLAAFVLLAHGIASLAGIAGKDDGFADPVFDLAFGFGVVAVMLPALLLTVRWAGRRPPGTLSSVTGGLRWRWQLDCARWAVLAIGTVLLVGLVQDGWQAAKWPGWGSWAQFALVIVLVVPLQAAAEEYLCRGWLFQAISSWTRSPWPAMVLTTALFVSLHDYTDPLVIIDLTVFSFALCWLTIRTGGLEAAIALHVVNNAVGLLLATTQGAPDLSQSGDYTAAQILPGTVATLAYTWWVSRRARSAGLMISS
ncbi:Membrane protease YdiL, CAAX protease family [Lentzea waywayandensis]|uniref:Membrane protease YdiL, CAAX protease family n=1 Tax=Lentzea waywayandensis TaxID=84724 RepID=A0A1I6FDU2_9PSEU|nr:type II CAAX endopeptidase family protein [Lentzea waywayandensis]SFR28078.1 Membrane protease YdiL, CAAX protease family [Lentzea waywayandensis]